MTLAELDMPKLLAPVACLPRVASHGGRLAVGMRVIPEETAVAFTYNGSTHAVMMATPADFEDFAAGLSLTERIVESSDDISELQIISSELGVELRMWILEKCMQPYSTRRRHLVGPTGCGLCGVESLDEAARPPPPVGEGIQLSRQQVSGAIAALTPAQVLNRATRAVHAAGFWRPDEGLVALREDVGRHNALDKLVGALARRRIAGRTGVVLLTSRVSVEMVQKTAILGASILIAVSAPTALAVRAAHASGVTLIAIARGQDFEIFAHPQRVAFGARRQATSSSTDMNVPGG
jgi:FdhD protein